MKEFLRSIKIINDFTITLNCPKSYFLQKLDENTEPSNINLFEPFRKGRPLRGTITGDTFKVRQRQLGSSNRRMMVRFTGIARQHNDKTIIDVEANSLHWLIMLPLFIMFTSVVIGLVIAFETPGFGYIFFLPMFIPVIFAFVIIYVVARRNSAEAPREIDKEFVYITKDYRD